LQPCNGGGHDDLAVLRVKLKPFRQVQIEPCGITAFFEYAFKTEREQERVH
jgi:hypothetical protein